jgi:RimJ/RimL family protein N-acetyltransferase
MELLSMGIDKEQMDRTNLDEIFSRNIDLPKEEKKSYCLLWTINDSPVGHSSIGNIKIGESAEMHLHLWDESLRGKGLSKKFLVLSMLHYLETFHFKKMLAEPNANNTSPNKTLESLGFRFLEQIVTVPGMNKLEQPINRWEITREEFEKKWT